MKRALLITGIACSISVLCPAQGVIVNEVSQGPSGAQEFIELMVVGSTTQPSGTVDLRDWVIDDNNGDFQLLDNTAPGIATGHFRLAPSDTFSAVPIGALLVIYNVADPNPAWTFRQLDINNADIPHIEDSGFTYYIPGTSTLLRACSGTPSSSSNSYAYTNSTIPPTSANWTGEIGLANTGDAIQTRKPDGTFYHGFGFSTPTQSNNFTSFPVFDGVSISSFNGFSGNAAGNVTYFDCGSYYYSSNYLSGSASTDETPGLPNNANNTLLVNNIRDGLFQYSQLALDVPCAEILPVKLLYFIGNLQDNAVYLQWATAAEYNNNRFIIQRSADQKEWKDMGTVKGQKQSSQKSVYHFTDPEALSGLSFYRLVQEDLDGKKEYTRIVSIQNSGKGKPNAFLYPNPITGNELNVISGLGIQGITIYDVLGRNIKIVPIANSGISEVTHIDISSLPKGYYYLKLQLPTGRRETLPFSRN